MSRLQHGFLSRRSTTTNILQCLDSWTKSIDNREPVDAIYLDMEKAFDTVSHPKLIFKLRQLGFGGYSLRWISRFLCGRTQNVRVQNSNSSPQTVISGIPQGTVLGPLLFLVYVNDMEDVLVHSNLSLYADD